MYFNSASPFLVPSFILALKFRKTLFQLLFTILSIYIFHLTIIPIATIVYHIIHLYISFNNYSYCKYFMHSGISKLVPLLHTKWLHLLIILSNDVSRNPGPPFHNRFFNLMSWNVNSIAKDDFQRVRLIEAHNSIFNYDLICICETSLND